MKHHIRLLLPFLIAVGAVFSFAGSAHATDYTQTRLMDDQVFNNVGSLSTSQVGDFLNGRSGPYTKLSAPSKCLATYNDQNFHWDGTSWHYGNDGTWNTAWGPAQIPASTIIAQAAQMWGINPEVIIATLEKEEGLVASGGAYGCTNSLNPDYQSAMGYGCPDSGGCNPKYAGFTKQVLWGSYQLEFGEQRSYGNTAWDGDDTITYVGFMTQGTRKRCGTCASNYYDGYASIDSQSVYMENGTTASLYSYTPHLGQSFPGIFEQWFGLAVPPTYSWSIVSTTYSRGNNQIPSTEKEVITVVAKNTGTATWSNSGGTVVKLGDWVSDRTSGFYDPSWAGTLRPAVLQESSVAPGANGTFSFVVQASAAGNYSERFNLVAEGQAWFNDAGLAIGFQVSPYSYSAQYVSDNFPTALQTGQTANVQVIMKNTGANWWYKSGSATVKLGTFNPTGHNSPYADTSWENATRAATMTEQVVAPGANATFSFTLKAPATIGSFSDTFANVAEGWSWMPASAFTKNLTTTGVYSASTAQTSFNVTVVAGTTYSQTLTYTNTGTAPWSNSSNPIVKLGAADPYGRTSLFADPSWLSTSRPALLNESSVATGANGTFNLVLKAPNQPGIYNEAFAPVAEGVTWITPSVTFTINVVPADYSWQVVSQTGSASIDPGDNATITLVVKNTGNVTWQKSSGFAVKLGTWGPDRTSAVASSSWPSPTRPALLTENSVAPGANGTFSFVLHGPYPGQFTEHFNLVAEGLTWFRDVGYAPTLTVRGNYPWNYVWHPVSASSSTGSLTLLAGSSATITITARNDGDATWHNGSTDFPVKLGTSNPLYRNSPFYDTSWPSTFRPAILQEASVPPNSTGTFVFIVKAPTTPGTYNEYFNPVLEGIRWFNDAGYGIPLTIN